MYGAPKLSILCLYRQLFRGRFFNVAFWTLFIATTLWIIAAWLLIVLQCGSHLKYLFGSSADLRGGHCLLGGAVVVPTAGIDVLLDLCILILPLLLVGPEFSSIVVSAIMLTVMRDLATQDDSMEKACNKRYFLLRWSVSWQ